MAFSTTEEFQFEGCASFNSSRASNTCVLMHSQLETGPLVCKAFQSRESYLSMGLRWLLDPCQHSAGNYGSALCVPPVTCAACSSGRSSCTCAACQLKKPEDIKGTTINEMIQAWRGSNSTDRQNQGTSGQAGRQTASSGG